MNFPEKHEERGIIYTLVKEYKNFALYESKTGIKRCFDKHDCDMIEKKIAYNIGGKYQV